MEKEQLNQTTTNEASETNQEAQQEVKVNIAEIRQKIEKRYEDKLSKAQLEFTAQLEAANKELEFYKTQLPQLEVAFTKNGGNKEFFNDWLKLNKDKLDYDNLDKAIQASFEVNKWAKASNGFNVSKTLNHAAGDNRRLDLADLEPGTVYKKMK